MKPTKNNLFVIEVKKDNVTASGIILQGDIETGIKPGIIVYAGPKCEEVKQGDQIYLDWKTALPVTFEGVKGALVSEDAVLAVISNGEFK